MDNRVELGDIGEEVSPTRLPPIAGSACIAWVPESGTSVDTIHQWMTKKAILDRFAGWSRVRRIKSPTVQPTKPRQTESYVLSHIQSEDNRTRELIAGME